MPLTRQQKKDLNIIDLEVYTMASEEAIDAKLEAFGNRKEEKMRSLFARQPYSLMAVISFVRIQEEQLNHEVRRTRVAPRPAMPRPTAPSTAIQTPTLKKLTRVELRERSAKELCWHCDEHVEPQTSLQKEPAPHD
ncbi:hypothetical protein BHM03_00024051 [Ensete ventricosum]|nr:hypothetical protein BHM03_00024051 [Ensete ventricosum]